MNRKVKHLMWELVTLLKTHIFSTYESFKENSTLVFIDFFTLLIMYCYANQCQFTANYL